MKKFKILVIILLTAFFAKGQNNYFNKIINGYVGPSVISSVVQIDSFYYALGCNIDTANTWQKNISLFKIDLNGNVVDSNIIANQFRAFDFMVGNSLVVADKSSLVACGATMDTSQIIEGFLFKFTTDLDTVWTKRFSHPDTIAASQSEADVYNHFTSLKPTLDHGFIITGNYTKNCITGNLRSYVLKTDSLGNMEFIKLHTNFYTFYDLVLADDSGYYIPACLNGNRPILVIKTDKYGNFEWSCSINTKSYGTYPAKIVNLNSNYLICCSLNWYNVADKLKSLIVSKIDLSSHSKLWEKEYFLYEDLEGFSLDQSVHAEKTKEGNILIGSSAVVSDSTSIYTYKGVLLKINPSGDSLWARNYGIGTFEDITQFNDFIVTDDGGILGAGFQYNYTTFSRNWIIKLDSFGCDTPGCQYTSVESLKVESGKLRVFPNPASRSITISNLDNKILPEGILQLFNNQGLFVKEVEIPNKQSNFELNISELSSGMYMGRFVGNGKNNWSFRFVKE